MTRLHQLVFIGWFLAVIYGVPLYQTGLDLARGHRPQILDLFTAVPTRTNLRALERQVEDSSAIALAARPWIQRVWFASLRNAGDAVLVGHEGWLFYKPDMRYLVEAPPGDAA